MAVLKKLTRQTAHDMEKAREKMEESEEVEQAAKVQVYQVLTWAERYDKASIEERHIIVSHLIERVEVGENYEISIKFKVAAESLLQKTA